MDQLLPPVILTKAMKERNTKPQAAWTNQCSLVEYQGQWIMFYHDKDLSPEDGNRRSVRADYITFNEDGTINKVTPTPRGVGICDARRHIQVDRYSAVSKTGAADEFLDESNRAQGWKVILSEKDAFVQYDRVEFGKTPLKNIKMRASSPTGGTVKVRIDQPDGPVVAEAEIPKGEFRDISSTLGTSPTGLHNLVVTQAGEGSVEIDWVAFE
jgi:hypothetical protein